MAGHAIEQPPEAIEMRIARLRETFRARFERDPDGVAEAPGRVNIIGEHLDYNEGLVLPTAIDRTVLAAYAWRFDATLRLYSVDYAEESCLSLDGPIARDEAHPWSNYLRGVVQAVIDEGFAGAGLDIAVTGNLPAGAGLASSAALEVAALGALRAAWRLDLDDKRLALLAQREENEFAGVQCGVMDQLAAALCREGHALLIDCRSLAHEQVPLHLEERGLAIVVVDSGVRRRLEDSAYNRRRDECAEALRLLRDAMPHAPPEALIDVTPHDLAAHADVLSRELLRRVRHVVMEQQRVEESADALRAGDLATLGLLMNGSHASLRDDFEVSCAELDRLVELAQALPGLLGARLTGAGFGGCTVNLVERDALPSFRAAVVETYAAETGLEAQLLVCRAADGLRLHEMAG